MRGVANPLRNWRIDPAAWRTRGVDLQHPECVLAERDGTLWVADVRGVVRIDSNEEQHLIAQRRTGDAVCAAPSLPNGIAFAANGDLLVANIGGAVLEVTRRDGLTHTLYGQVDGAPIGKVNFVLRDSRDRLWISVSTRIDPIFAAVRPGLCDGYIALADERGICIVADGFQFTNELRLDAEERWLYVVETTAQRICRLRVHADGSLTDREIFGPTTLSPGFPDGIAFDAAGNLWCAIAMVDQLVAITPGGDLLTLYTDGNGAAAAAMDRHFLAGTLAPEMMLAACGKLAPGMSSIAFGGPDLRTVFIGSSMGSCIPFCRSPVAGLPLTHQR